jgi:hypothetical protein
MASSRGHDSRGGAEDAETACWRTPPYAFASPRESDAKIRAASKMSDRPHVQRRRRLTKRGPQTRLRDRFRCRSLGFPSRTAKQTNVFCVFLEDCGTLAADQGAALPYLIHDVKNRPTDHAGLRSIAADHIRNTIATISPFASEIYANDPRTALSGGDKGRRCHSHGSTPSPGTLDYAVIPPA